MSGSLREYINKNNQYLKLGDGETIKCFYVNWEAVTTKFGKKGFEFTFEREDGSRFKWTTSNMGAVNQISDLLDKGLKKGGCVEIKRVGLEKTDTKYFITEALPF